MNWKLFRAITLIFLLGLAITYLYVQYIRTVALISLSKHKGEPRLELIDEISETAALAIKERLDPIGEMNPAEFLSQYGFDWDL